MVDEVSVEWGRRALKQFKSAVLYISDESLQGAEKFRVKILERIPFLKNIQKLASSKNTSTKKMAVTDILSSIGTRSVTGSQKMVSTSFGFGTKNESQHSCKILIF